MRKKGGFGTTCKDFFSKAKAGISKAWKWYKGLYKGKPWYIKSGIGFCSAILCFILYLFAVYFNLFWLFGKSPSMDEIMNPRNNEASIIYSADGVVIGKYFNENRTPVTYEEINPIFFKALISTEDERFYSHHGIDFTGLFAAAKDAMHGKARGASTITQQLVKNMFRVRTKYSTGLLGKIPGVKILIMKSKEWIIAVQLEMFYSKEEILKMYANTVDFGSNAYGIKTACKTYFNTTPQNLKAEQAAVLVGLLRATSYYNPKINPKNSLRRRNVVLDNMYSHNMISKAECDSIKELPINLNFNTENEYDGQALYFRQAVANSLKDWCEKEDIDLYKDGLKIYTTIDTRMQKYAEDAVIKQMKVVQNNFKNHWGKTDPWQDENHNTVQGFIEGIAKRSDYYNILVAKFPNNMDSVNYYLNKPHNVRLFDYDGGHEEFISTMDSIRYMVRFMHTGFVAMEPKTGHIKAWVGDIDFKAWKYDKVTAMRQPGSTFKLFVYTAAMNMGLTPCDKRMDSYIRMDVINKDGNPEVWTPHNANGSFSGDSMSLKSAFAQSINSIAVKLGQEVTIPEVIRTAQAMGINSPLDNQPSLALGSSDVNLLELVNSYCTVANDGKMHDPVLVTKIVDRDGNVIYTSQEVDRQAIPYRSAFYMQQLLLGGLTEPGGTSMALWGYVSPFSNSTDFGGKTGTSNNHSDAWFVGVSPNLVCGAWVGGEYRCIHFRTGALGQGSRTALPICGYFFQSVLGDPKLNAKYKGKFGKPKEYIDPNTYTCQGCWKKKEEVDSIGFGGDSLGVVLDHEVEPLDDDIDISAEPAKDKAKEPKKPDEAFK